MLAKRKKSLANVAFTIGKIRVICSYTNYCVKSRKVYQKGEHDAKHHIFIVCVFQ